jgi:hypothetical protein
MLDRHGADRREHTMPGIGWSAPARTTRLECGDTAYLRAVE